MSHVQGPGSGSGKKRRCVDNAAHGGGEGLQCHHAIPQGRSLGVQKQQRRHQSDLILFLMRVCVEQGWKIHGNFPISCPARNKGS